MKLSELLNKILSLVVKHGHGYVYLNFDKLLNAVYYPKIQDRRIKDKKNPNPPRIAFITPTNWNEGEGTAVQAKDFMIKIINIISAEGDMDVGVQEITFNDFYECDVEYASLHDGNNTVEGIIISPSNTTIGW